MTRTMGWLGCGLAALALMLTTSEAEARHRRGGSDGGYGSAGGRGSFGGLFSRRRGGDCYSDHGSSGGYGSNGGHASSGGHGQHVGSYYSEPSTEGSESNGDPGQPPAAPEMTGSEATPSASANSPNVDRDI